MKSLDINTTDFLKAILPFGIVITHYIPLYGYDTLLLGESIVAMFFFMSGYGLSMSKKKITKYLVIQRVSRLLVPFALSIILFQLASLVCGNMMLSKLPMSKNITDGIGLILPNSWFVYAIVLFYAIFHILFYTLKGKRLKYITLFFAMMIYIKLMAKFVVGEHWHITALAFCSGAVYKEVAKRVNGMQNMIFFFLGAIVIILMNFVSSNFYLRILFFALMPIVVSSVLSNVGLKINKTIAWLRTISYPIYLVHGIVIFLYCHFHLEGIMSLFWGLLLVGGATIPIAYFVSSLEKEVQFKCFV